ncbi:MAG: InlB B-repeat-containing protein [Candidatus Methanomethylophilaceae archaeon]|nr:InlB B-repeat-containing protein [Candidatus Methanomethylophilaceae archaeon]
MASKTTILILTCVLVASAVGGFILLSSSGSSGNMVEYYDGNVLIKEQNFSGNFIASEFSNPNRDGEYTFFGWSTLPEGKGIKYVTNDKISIDRSLKLYAMVADGTLRDRGNGLVDFSLSGIHADIDQVYVDTSFIGYSDKVRISYDTMRLIADSNSSLKLSFDNNVDIVLDKDAVSHCTSKMPVGMPLMVNYHRDHNVGTMGVSIISDSEISALVSGNIMFSVTSNDGSYMKAFEGKKIIQDSSGMESGRTTFITNNISDFRVVELFEINAETEDGSSIDIDKADNLIFSVKSSDYYDICHMLAKGDTFSLEPSSRSYHLNVVGVSKSNSIYVVSGISPINIILVEGDPIYNIILPEDQLGYSLTSDVSTLSEGGRCVVTYSLKSGYMDDDLIILLNGFVVEHDGMNRIYISDVKEDQIFSVSGVLDKRTYTITVPDDQIGYMLTASETLVHYGQSYEITYVLNPGYEQGSSFKISANGGVGLIFASGTVTVENVHANQILMVTGVDPVDYMITGGNNVVIKVNGVSASTATVEDVITIEPASGYSLPSTFRSNISGLITACEGGYKITGNVAFPSISKLTVGNNVLVNGTGENSVIYVCSTDPLSISAKAGYSLPDNYSTTISSLSGVTHTSTTYMFADDVSLPSIYKVQYMGYSTQHAKYYQISGSILMIPSDPIRLAYEFVRWDFTGSIVTCDLIINSEWSPCVYQVTFGPNLIVNVDGITYAINATRVMSINSSQSIVIRAPGNANLPEGYAPNDLNGRIQLGGYYSVIGDCIFPGLSAIMFSDEVYDTPSAYAVIGHEYYPPSLENKDNLIFLGWKLDTEFISSITVVNLSYVLIATWI